MPELPLWHFKFLVVLVAFLIGMSCGTERVSESACRGASVELFRNISFRSDDLFVYLHKSVDITTMIAMWYNKNSVFNASFKNGYSEKIFLDKFGSIWMRNLDITDDAIYTTTIEIGSSSTKYDLQLTVLVAPTTACKPTILRTDNILTADLEAKNCGKPVASVYWQKNPGISLETKVIKIQPGKEAGIYHACIQGDALKCAKNFKLTDYCSVFVIDENTNSNTILPVYVSLMILTLAAMLITILMFLWIRRKKILRRNRRPRNQDELLPQQAADDAL